jgi:7-cyano-7-deazaguanine synthase
MKTIVVCSGGLDSVSLAHRIAAEQQLLGLISFDYGQRHRKELDFAAALRHRGSVSSTRSSTCAGSAAG